MGGGGGSTSYGTGEQDPTVIRDRLRRELQQQELQTEVNDYLRDQLTSYNDRDTESVNDRLDQINEALSDGIEELDRLLFGGSIAKHTYVDGLSDTDALVILRGEQSDDPAKLLRSFATLLGDKLPANDIDDISVGRLAVTVRYRDGSEIQLLPARHRGDRLAIASENGRDWREIRPRKFAEKLTQVNQANGGAVVPAIKLAKAALDRLPERDQLSGYHIEAIAVDAFRNYQGPRNRQALLRHLLDHASQAILRPSGDITGQSVRIDQHLGATNSTERQRIAAAIGRIVKRMDSATSVTDYRELFGES